MSYNPHQTAGSGFRAQETALLSIIRKLNKIMKRTIITLMVLGAGISCAADSESYTLDILPEFGSATFITSSWNATLGNPSSTGDTMADALQDAVGAKGTGWYWGVGDGKGNDAGVKNDVSLDAEDNSLKFTGRYAYKGEYVIAVVAVADVLSGNTDATIGHITLSFDTNQRATSARYSAWLYNGTTTTELIAPTAIQLGFNSVSVGNLEIEATDKIFFVFNDNSGGVPNKLENLKAVALIPEPTTATLSILALASLAVRRRRK